MESEEKRLETFKDWPPGANVPVDAFKGTGLYYTGSDDKVQCYRCERELQGWQEGDNPADEHRTHYPDCPLSAAPVASPSKSPGKTTSDAVMKKPPDNIAQPVLFEKVADLKKGRAAKIEYPQYEDEKKRLDTFQKWSKSPTLNPKVLVEAGFFFTEQGDKVRCYSCGLALEGWDTGDDPLAEHRKFADKCPYVAKLKEMHEVPKVVEQPKYLQPTPGSPIEEEIKLPQQLVDHITCIICKTRYREILFEPCSHFILCDPCSVNHDLCPLCRQPITRKSKWYRKKDGKLLI